MSGPNQQGSLGGAPSIQANGQSIYEHIAETAEDTAGYRFETTEHRALEIELVTRVIGTGSITVIIERLDKSSNTWIMVLTGAAVVTNTTNRYKVTPDLVAAANLVAQDHLGETMRVRVQHNNANPTTYSLSYHLAN